MRDESTAFRALGFFERQKGQVNASMKNAFIVVVALVLVTIPMAIIGWYRWDTKRNHGSEFGYYGQYNRVSNALATIPGVGITKRWNHEDLTLEEFGFDLLINGKPISLSFEEKDPVRKMEGIQMKAALQSRIATELSRTNMNP